MRDSRTHIETWNALRAVVGRADFPYVADSKLCSRENLDHYDAGRDLKVRRLVREEHAYKQARRGRP